MSSYCKTCVYGNTVSWECEDCYDSLTGAPPTGYKEDKRSSKCSRCGFCNSLNAVSHSVPNNALVTYYLRQAEAVIEELCCDQEEIPFFAQTLSDLRVNLRGEKATSLIQKIPFAINTLKAKVLTNFRRDSIMGTRNKKHNRKIHRVCPICGERPRVAHGGMYWWIVCPTTEKEFHGHIEQKLFYRPEDAINDWNESAT